MEEEQEKQKNYSNMLQQSLIFNSPGSKLTADQENQVSILKFKSPISEKNLSDITQYTPLFSPALATDPQKRVIQKSPVKVLDAPGLVDDFYVDILDWSASDYLGICLSDQLYLWDSKSGNVHKLTESLCAGVGFTSIKFRPFHNQITIGASDGAL